MSQSVNRDRDVSRPRIPTPDELVDNPENALLHALDEIMELLPRVLVAAHPELADPDAPVWRREAQEPTRYANDIVADAHRLQKHIRAYRHAITRVRDQRVECDPDIPF